MILKKNWNRKNKVIIFLHVKILQEHENSRRSIQQVTMVLKKKLLITTWNQRNKKWYTNDLDFIMLRKELNLDLTINDLDQSHWIEKDRIIWGNRKSRPLIVKFARYMVHRNVLKHNNIKGKHISITESLIKKPMKKLTEPRQQHRFWNMWTSNGKILVRKQGNPTSKTFYD